MATYILIFLTGRMGGNPPAGEVKKSKDLVTDLHGLLKYGNYTVRVAAFTNGGEGVRSAPLHCLTEEDGNFTLFSYASPSLTTLH